MRHYLITGGAGFIGSNLIKKIFEQEENARITCIDNFDPFYPREIKDQNIKTFADHPGFTLIEDDIGEKSAAALSEKIAGPVDVIIHLAAKAGVRPSIKNPGGYIKTNIIGTQNLLDLAVAKNIKHFIFASSSSVYGINEHLPWKEDENLSPISPYAMTKLSCEQAGHVYHNLYGLSFIALRFFTVYGPGQRPDLAIHKFTKSIIKEEPIPVFGDGSTSRDYTFIDDIVKGIIRAAQIEGKCYEIINLGNHNTVTLSELIAGIEAAVGKKAIINRLPDQPGDLPATYADTSKAMKLLGYQPNTPLKEGLEKFVDWFKANSALLLK